MAAFDGGFDFQHLHLPLAMNDGLRSAISSRGGVVSLLLSAEDFAKLDLSNIHLFSVNSGLSVVAGSNGGNPSAAELPSISSESSSGRNPSTEGLNSEEQELPAGYGRNPNPSARGANRKESEAPAAFSKHRYDRNPSFKKENCKESEVSAGVTSSFGEHSYVRNPNPSVGRLKCEESEVSGSFGEHRYGGNPNSSSEGTNHKQSDVSNGVSSSSFRDHSYGRNPNPSLERVNCKESEVSVGVSSSSFREHSYDQNANANPNPHRSAGGGNRKENEVPVAVSGNSKLSYGRNPNPSTEGVSQQENEVLVAVSGDSKITHSRNPDSEAENHNPAAEEEDLCCDSFSFETPAILSPEISYGSFAIPFFKSKAVLQAEQQQALTLADRLTPKTRKKALSLDEATLAKHLKKQDSFPPSSSSSLVPPSSPPRRSQDDSSVPLPRTRLRPAALDVAETKARNRQQMEQIMLNTVTEEARIDLKASPAARFLLQVMPWELGPSPTTTPAAVPFLWEEAPGKPYPKPCLTPTPRPLPLPLPPRSREVYNEPMPPFLASNNHSWNPLQNLFPGTKHELSNQKQTSSSSSSSSSSLSSSSTSTLPLDYKRGEANLLPPVEQPNLDSKYELPSPYVATYTPLTSPYRNLGPPEEDEKSRGAKQGGGSFSGLMKIIRRGKKWPSWVSQKEKSKSKSKSKTAPSIEASPLDGTESLLGIASDDNGQMERRPDVSLNTRIAAAMDARVSIKQENHVVIVGSEAAAQWPIKSQQSKPRKQRKGKSTSNKWTFRRLRRSSRFIVAIYRAMKRAIIARKISRQKLLGGSKHHYQSLA